MIGLHRIRISSVLSIKYEKKHTYKFSIENRYVVGAAAFLSCEMKLFCNFVWCRHDIDAVLFAIIFIFAMYLLFWIFGPLWFSYVISFSIALNLCAFIKYGNLVVVHSPSVFSMNLSLNSFYFPQWRTKTEYPGSEGECSQVYVWLSIYSIYIHSIEEGTHCWLISKS